MQHYYDSDEELISIPNEDPSLAIPLLNALKYTPASIPRLTIDIDFDLTYRKESFSWKTLDELLSCRSELTTVTFIFRGGGIRSFVL